MAQIPQKTSPSKRNSLARLRLRHPTVSKMHARVIIGEEGASIQDLGSLNGTKINGTAIAPGKIVPLGAGDKISIGKYEFTFRERST